MAHPGNMRRVRRGTGYDMTHRSVFRSPLFRCSVAGILLPVFAMLASAQPVATGLRRLSLDISQQWAAPRFSPDGRRVYFTTVGFAGIWEYDRATTQVRTITTDPGSGYGFALSDDGKSIAYRRTTVDQSTHRRRQDIVVHDLQAGTDKIAGTGPDLSLPAYKGGSLLFVSPRGLERGPASAPAGMVILGIEQTKIAVVRDGVKTLLDPMGNGSYVWPSLSPDGSTILAVEVQRGAFLCRPDGTLIRTLGRLDAPAWTRDGRWIVSLAERDDGDRILSSHITILPVDGGSPSLLTNDPLRVDLDPQCSPTDNTIAFSTGDGEIYLLQYEEGAR